MAELVPETKCDHCGQVDNHPKSHWNTGKTFHLDCLPYDLKAQLVESAPHIEAVIAKAVEGVHGEALKAFNDEVHAQLPAPSVEESK